MKKLLFSFLLCGPLYASPLFVDPQFQNPNQVNTTQPWGFNYIPPANRPWMQPSYDNPSETIIIDQRTIIVNPNSPEWMWR